MKWLKWPDRKFTRQLIHNGSTHFIVYSVGWQEIALSFPVLLSNCPKCRCKRDRERLTVDSSGGGG